MATFKAAALRMPGSIKYLAEKALLMVQLINDWLPRSRIGNFSACVGVFGCVWVYLSVFVRGGGGES